MSPTALTLTIDKMLDKTLLPVKTDEQIQLLAKLADAIWHEYFSGMLSDAQIDYMVKAFQSKKALRNQIRTDGYLYFFILSDRKPVGYMGLRPEKNRLFLSKIYIQKDDRGKGFFSFALDYIEKLARDMGLEAIYLTVYQHNTSSIQIYQKKGFRIIGTQVKPIGQGYIMDDYILEKKQERCHAG